MINVHVKGDFPEQDTSERCNGENEVEITFGWREGQEQAWDEWSGGTEPIAAGVEDVEVPDITCEYCGHVFTQPELDAIANGFEPTPRDDY
jgi:hypothetical protein